MRSNSCNLYTVICYVSFSMRKKMQRREKNNTQNQRNKNRQCSLGNRIAIWFHLTVLMLQSGGLRAILTEFNAIRSIDVIHEPFHTFKPTSWINICARLKIPPFSIFTAVDGNAWVLNMSCMSGLSHLIHVFWFIESSVKSH